ncbi:hydantoinase B/oxoprolinase [Diplocarpon rosae]|nr:hydantoinase B/oxoprolinase [Diplocarpon rosae]
MNEPAEVTKLEHYNDSADVANALEKIPTSSPISLDSAEQDLTHQVLRFLSTASSETIGGLAACTYLVFGRVGLVLIGALGGVVLHANWERHIPGSSEDARKERGLDVVHRILDLRAAQRQNTEDDKDDEMLGAGFEGFKPETAAALDQLVDAVIRDYVRWWYQPILPTETSFPAASRQTLTKFILAISQHLSRKRHADTFLDFLTNSSSIVIVFLGELSNALTASQGTNVPPAEAVYTYLSANPESSLANVLNEEQQSKKFKMVAEDILQNFLEKSTYNCDPARAFLREILGGLVLQMSLETFSKPEWINGWIVYLLEDGEPDFSQAIDAGMGGSNASDQLSAPTYNFDGNVGNIGLAKPSQSEKQRLETRGHKKRLSKAEEAMEEAMEEAQRLSQLIAEEDAKRVQPGRNSLENTPEAVAAAVEQNVETLRRDMSGIPSEKTLNRHTLNNLPISNGHLTSRPLQPVGGSKKPAEPSTLITQSAAHRHSQDLMSSPQLFTSPTPTRNAPAFTNFDQMIPQSVPVALQEDSPAGRRATVSLTLHNANTIIHDDSTSSDRGRVRSKPNADYLIQIEPASSDHPGWMIARRYSDFENLHEVLRRIAQISGVKAFAEQHHTLPNWKEHTKASLRGELERYLRDALWYKELAESEGMKRFLERDQGQAASASTPKNGFPGLGWPTPSAFETMGKGMLDVLTSAPKGVAEGGKVIGGGITGVFSNIGNLGQKKTPNGSSTNVGMQAAGRSSTPTLPRMDARNSIVSSSEDSLRTTSIVQTQPSSLPPMERRPSYISLADSENEREPGASARSSMSGRRSIPHSRSASKTPSLRRGTPLSSPTPKILDDMKLPPLPNDISDDYGSRTDSSSIAHSRTESGTLTRRTSTSTAPSQQSPGRPSLSATRRSSVQAAAPSRKPQKEQTPITEAETKVAVELLFAVINELYTLSSAWNIRRTLLNAAKQFLLRPANPSLVAIQTLIQDSVIAANTSDAGIASHLRKLRENTLPTEEEAKQWPAEMTSEEKDKLRVKARKLLVERGIPTALTGVMGQAATGEAVGRVFDCLQVNEVAKGLMFGLVLQVVRAVTQ